MVGLVVRWNIEFMVVYLSLCLHTNERRDIILLCCDTFGLVPFVFLCLSDAIV